jgi:nicotinamide-nucleotide amidase
MTLKRSAIITIGNELLKGRTINTNFAKIGKALTFSGYEVFRGFVVDDSLESISWAVRSAIEISDIVITSGGLGPTFDDMTLKGVSIALGREMVFSEQAKSQLKEWYSHLNLEMTPEREKMAYVPDGSEIIQNPVGAAPGIMVSKDSKIIVCLPGVPAEMEAMLNLIIDRIKNPGSYYYEKSVRLYGIMESTFAPYVNEIMKRENELVYIKSHPLNRENNFPGIELEVSARSDTQEKAEQKVNSILEELTELAKKLKS